MRLVKKPTLILHSKKVMCNIDVFVQKAARRNVRFRPHFKTHQSAEIGQWFHERGVEAITVSSVDMALYFADHHWKDITIAFPVNVLQGDDINALAQRVNLHLLVEAVETVEALDRALEHEVNVWLKIDVGSQRTGIAWNDEHLLNAVARAVASAPRLRLQGLLTHDGRTYRARSRDEIIRLHEEGVGRLKVAQAALARAGMQLQLSIGDTPACSVVDVFEGIDEIRPGNFVFYDLQQVATTACTEADIAVAVACPVVAKHRSRYQVVLYGGAVHLSKDYVMDDGRPIYGRVTRLTHDGWGPSIEGAYVAALSQEHGVVQLDASSFDSVQVGDLLLVLPAHSCLAANLLRRYLTLEGDWIEMADLH